MDGNDIERRKAELIAEINVVFDGVSRSGGSGLREWDTAYDLGAHKDRDWDTRWQETEVESVELWASVLRGIDPIGFRYYWPAFMVHGLKKRDEDYVLEFLTNTGDPRWGAFKDSEKKTIARYLQFLVDFLAWETQEYLRELGWSEEEVAAEFEEEISYRTNKRAITRVLDQYWGQFLNVPDRKW